MSLVWLVDRSHASLVLLDQDPSFQANGRHPDLASLVRIAHSPTASAGMGHRKHPISKAGAVSVAVASQVYHA
jgi:hypothetical protein